MGEGSRPTTESNATETSGRTEELESANNDTGSRTSAHAPVSKKEEYVAPPDGGWGWMVVFGSFLIHVIADGVVYSFGVFLIEFVQYFDAGRGAASWVGSLQPAVTYTVGPLSSALTNRYGCRFVTILGAVISAIGFILSMFAPNLYFLYATAGVMAGLGFGLIYLPAIVCVAQYFEKRRSFATGLAVCGSGFGTFILAPLTEYLIKTYSWRGTFLILGAVILNIIICGIIFRPVESVAVVTSTEEVESTSCSDRSPPETQEETKALLASADKGKTGDDGDDDDDVDKKTMSDDRGGNDEKETTTVEHPSGNTGRVLVTVTGEAGKLRGEGEGGDSCEMVTLNNVNKNHLLKDAPNGQACPSDTDVLISSLTIEVTLPTESAPESPPSEFHSEMANGHHHHHPYQLSTSQCIVLPGRDKKSGKNLAQIAASEGALHCLHPGAAGEGRTGRAGTHFRRRRQDSQGSTPPSTPRPLTRKDIFYSGSLYNIPMYKSNPDLYIAAVTPVQNQSQQADDDQLDGASGSCVCLEVFSDIRSTLSEMLSFSLLKNPLFLMFAISNFFTSIGFNMPFIFLPDRAILAGIDESRAAFLLSVIGIANTAGRVIFGFLSDRPWVNRLFLYNTALTICGVATAFSSLIGDQYTLFVVYAIVFGVFIGVYVSLTSVVLVDLLGLEYLTNSFGLLLLFQGAATFIGPPMAGWIYDWTGSYDISFILMGSLIALSGTMLYLLPFVERRYNKKLSKADIQHDIDLGKQKVTTDSEDSPSTPLNSV